MKTPPLVVHGPWPARCAASTHLRRQATLTCGEPPEHPLPHVDATTYAPLRVTWEAACGEPVPLPLMGDAACDLDREHAPAEHEHTNAEGTCFRWAVSAGPA